MIGTARQKSKILAPLRYIISVNALIFCFLRFQPLETRFSPLFVMGFLVSNFFKKSAGFTFWRN